MPLKALIKFSQSNQIMLKSFLPFPGLVSEPSRQVPQAGAPRATESQQFQLRQRLDHSCEERKQIGPAEG